jgi:hypothetical protein
MKLWFKKVLSRIDKEELDKSYRLITTEAFLTDWHLHSLRDEWLEPKQQRELLMNKLAVNANRMDINRVDKLNLIIELIPFIDNLIERGVKYRTECNNLLEEALELLKEEHKL